MKIAIMSRWNATCGVSLHAELLGRKFREMNYEVKVFAPTLESANNDWHHRLVDVEDESWVYRIYSETNEFYYPDGGWIDYDILLNEDYDILLVEGYQRLPVKHLKKIIKQLKRKAKLVLVVHTGYIRDLLPYMKIPWDAITVFDTRYINELIKIIDPRVVEKTIVIPYPHAIIDDVKPFYPEFGRNKIVFITYGRQPVAEYLDYLKVLQRLNMEYDIVYWIIRSDNALPFKEPWIVQWVESPSIRTIYSYVMGSYIHLLPKSDSKAVVVSSTVAQILYSGTPTVVPNTRYFETIQVSKNGFGPVVKYDLGNTVDLYRKLKILIENKNVYKMVSQKAREYALRYSDRFVAKTYIDLFRKLLNDESIKTLSITSRKEFLSN